MGIAKHIAHVERNLTERDKQKLVSRLETQLSESLTELYSKNRFFYSFIIQIFLYTAGFSDKGTTTAAVRIKKDKNTNSPKFEFLANPVFFDLMNKEERMGVVVHELLHIIHRHIQRTPAYSADFRVLNFAADIINNRDILSYTRNPSNPYTQVSPGIDLPRMGIFDGLFDFGSNDVSTTDSIYKLLMSAKEKAKAKGPMSEAERKAFLAKHPGLAEEPTPENRFGLSPENVVLNLDPVEYYRLSLRDDKGQGQGQGKGQGRGQSQGEEQDEGQGSDEAERGDSDAVGGHSDHSHWEEDSQNVDGEDNGGRNNDKETQQRINRALVKAARDSGFSGIPGSLVGFLKELMKDPIQDWKAILRMQVASSASLRRKTTSMKESRRFPREEGLPGGLGSKTLRDVNVTVAVDTSGSIDDDVLAQFIAEVRKIQKSGAVVDLFFFHHDVYHLDDKGKPLAFKKFDLSTFSKESGGTDFNPPFAVVKKLSKKPDLFIILTDGIAPPPSVNLGMTKYLWAIYGLSHQTQDDLKNNSYVAALPGKKVYLSDK